jgi:hypothetical protein
MTILLPNNDQNVTILSQNNNQNMTIDKIKKTDNTTCEYCNKEYSAYTHLKRHQKKCKNKQQKEDDIKKIKEEHEEVKKQIVELKAQLLQVMNDTYKMHPKTFNKINNDIANNQNNNSNSNNNITINNINYVEYGNENLHEIFTPQEAIKLLNYGYNSLEEIIKYTHLNDKYPQFQTIIITNKRNNEAYVYNEKLQKFILCDKQEVLEELIEFRMDDLIWFYNEHKNKLDTHLIKLLEHFFTLKRDDNFLEEKCSEFNIIIYNQCDKTKIKNEFKSSLTPNTVIND